MFGWHTLNVFPNSHELAWAKKFPSLVSVSRWWRAHGSCSSGARGRWSAFFLLVCASQRHAETERSWTKSVLNFRELQLGSKSLALNVTFIKAVHFLIYQGALEQRAFKSRWSQSVLQRMFLSVCIMLCSPSPFLCSWAIWHAQLFPLAFCCQWKEG